MKIRSILVALAFTAPAFAQKPITIVNPSTVNRPLEVVAVSWSKVLQAYPGIDTANLRITTAGKEVPFQFEKLGTDKVQNLLLYVGVKAKSASVLKFEKAKHAEFKAMTYARYVPERKDDFAWENDKIAFRMYGKALEGTNEDANGTDIWAKKTTDLVINNWYKTADYHVDHGQGLDFYSVGLTLGAGDVAPFYQGKVVYPKHYRRFKVLDNGPLRSTFVLEFDAFDVGGKSVTMTKTISLDAGSRLNKVAVKANFSGSEKLPLVVGLVTDKQPGGKIYQDAKAGTVSYWQTPTDESGTIGVGALVKGSFKKTFVAQGQLLAELDVNKNTPFVYYNGGVWDKQGEITTGNQWNEYLKNFKQKLLTPLIVK